MQLILRVLVCRGFSICVEVLQLVSITPDSVRKRVNLTAVDVPDDIVNQFIQDAVETIEIEADLSIDPANCTAAQAVPIRNLAAIYCACKVTGGSASGLNFRVGDLSVDESSSGGGSGLSGSNLQFLMNEVQRFIDRFKTDFRMV